MIYVSIPKSRQWRVFWFMTIEAERKGADRLTKQEALDMVPVMAKSSVIGTVIGAIPGTGSAIAAYLSYNEAKRCVKPDERFGEGEFFHLGADRGVQSEKRPGSVKRKLAVYQKLFLAILSKIIYNKNQEPDRFHRYHYAG